MPGRFLHAADIHLGYYQYNNETRHDDFSHAFDEMARDALQLDVDFLLIAGDLFHKRNISPRTLLQATRILQRLHEAGIPVLAIEGNHERRHYGERFSWLDFLASLELLHVLTGRYQDGQLELTPWDSRRRDGAYLDLPNGVRVIGMKYQGASTPRVIEDLVPELERLAQDEPAYTILMLHTGMQNILPHYASSLSRSDLEALHPYVDYLALGHIHKPFIQDDWIYNPGSLETVSIDEAQWEERGYFCVDLPSPPSKSHQVSQIRSKRRPFVRLSFETDAYQEPEKLHRDLGSYVERRAQDGIGDLEAVIELRLEGVLAFERSELDLAWIEATVAQQLKPLLCRIKDDTTRSEYEIETEEEMTREMLERHVLRELIERDSLQRPYSRAWADVILSLKKLALSNNDPDAVVSELDAFERELAAASAQQEAEPED